MFFKKIAAMAVSGDHKDRRNKNRMSHPPIYTHPQIFILTFFLFLGQVVRVQTAP